MAHHSFTAEEILLDRIKIAQQAIAGSIKSIEGSQNLINGEMARIAAQEKTIETINAALQKLQT